MTTLQLAQQLLSPSRNTGVSLTPKSVNQKIEVKVYSTPTCAYCRVAKQYFIENNIPYREINVLSDSQGREEMVKISGGFSVPVISIGNKIIIGWDRSKVEEYLGNH